MTLIFRVELLACEGRRLFLYVRVVFSEVRKFALREADKVLLPKTTMLC
jgi:hypothetical protein